ncbi:MAG: hypothetical protein ACEPOW_08855 [Bacteroidales bacterium]
MRTKLLKPVMAMILPLAIMACKKERLEQPNNSDNKLKSSKEIVFDFDFNQGTEGWEVDYADYPQGAEEFYELNSGIESLPHPLNQKNNAFMISGNNHSDDLFMFFKREISGLEPNTYYELQMEVQFASRYPKNSMGSGGSPGESIYFKAGGSTEKPTTTLDNSNHYRLNIDKGEQSVGGKDLAVLGDIATENLQGDYVYEVISRNNYVNNQVVKSDDEGNLWLSFGTDSGFEATTTLYYTKVNVQLKQE